MNATSSFNRPAIAARFEAGLWILAAAALSIALWTKADAWNFQVRSREWLADPGAASGSGSHGDPASAAPIAAGTAFARLAIPRVALDVVVAEGTSSATLRRAVGHLPASARPGQSGNMVLAGHRDTFFRPLEDLRAGDEIFVDSASGRHAYRVEWIAVVPPHRVDLAGETGYRALTLVTCYPFRYVGSAPQRFVVRARQTEP